MEGAQKKILFFNSIEFNSVILELVSYFRCTGVDWLATSQFLGVKIFSEDSLSDFQ